MRGFDFSSWQSVLFTLIAVSLVALIGVGIRVLAMQTIQQRQQRMNRQINERLRTLIAAYRTLGGSFTGELSVNPAHLRDLRATAAAGEPGTTAAESPPDRPRRIRDAVEAALSDIILLGTEDQVRLAAQAATDMAAGRPIRTAELVVSLRDFIRLALDLEPIPRGVQIPLQGPTRPQGGAGRSGKGEGGRDRGPGTGEGGDRGGAAGGGTGIGMNVGLGSGRTGDPG